MIYFVALREAHGFVLAVLSSVLLNNIFFVVMRAPTALGRTALQQLAGFREFLVRVEQDRLARGDTPQPPGQPINRFLPPALPPGVAPGRGRSLPSALFPPL